MTAQAPFSARGASVTGLVTLLIILLGFGGWASTAQIAKAVVARGVMQVAQHNLTIQHPAGGTIATLEVQDGDLVTAGQVLFTLDSTALTTQQEATQTQLIELLARKARLEAERDGLPLIQADPALDQGGTVATRALAGQEQLFRAHLETLSQEVAHLGRRRDQYQAQLVGIAAQADALQQQITLGEAESKRVQTLLDKGLISTSRMTQERQATAELAGRAGALDAAEAEMQGRITEVEMAMLRLSTERAEQALTELRALELRELELRNDLTARAEKIARMTSVAPVSGAVHSLQLHGPGEVIQPAQPVLMLVPQDQDLIATVQIPANDVDQVFVGQEVRVRFSTLDPRRPPEVPGRVSALSADSYSDQSSGALFYRAQVALTETGTLSERQLVPGIPVDVLLQTGQSTLLSSLLAPLTTYFQRAFVAG